MDKRQLYQAVKDRKASLVFGKLEVELSTLTADGTNTHKKRDLETTFCSYANLYRIAEYPDETMAQLRKRDKELFEDSMKKISEAVNKYKVKI